MGPSLGTGVAPDLDLEALVPEVQYQMAQGLNLGKMGLVLGSEELHPTLVLVQDLAVSMKPMDLRAYLGKMSHLDLGPGHTAVVPLPVDGQWVSEKGMNTKIEGMTEVEVEAGQKSEMENRVRNIIQGTSVNDVTFCKIKNIIFCLIKCENLANIICEQYFNGLNNYQPLNKTFLPLIAQKCH
jgi:hypothetical protein